MRRFTSYGPVNTQTEYYAPRQGLIDLACQTLVGDQPEFNGHYFTAWASRQAGKTWIMQQATIKLKAENDFDVAITTMQSAKSADTPKRVLDVLVENLRTMYGKDFPDVEIWEDLRTLFTHDYFDRPIILILDEFDSLEPQFIAALANEFRSIYLDRQNQVGIPSREKKYLLHGLALIGIRGVLGIENQRGSPFNVQRGMHIPNLTHAEVDGMFKWYEQENGQTVEQSVIDRLFYETQGQPGLVGWFGQLLTEDYNDRPDEPLDDASFQNTFIWATQGLGNNNISNLISKAKQPEYREFVLTLFKTGKKIPFRFDDATTNFLYLNGVIDLDRDTDGLYVKFPSPFVQKRLFNYFATELFQNSVDRLFDPFEDLTNIITEERINIRNLMRRYEQYLQENRDWLFKGAPRRKSDLRILEAVYHFNLYVYLYNFLDPHDARLWPEFPTGNGQMDIFIRYEGVVYGLEVKSFVSQREYRKGLRQAARYGKDLGHSEMWLLLFVEGVDDENRRKYEQLYSDKETGVLIHPVLVAIGA
ncbi:MAG: hypothetical protein AAF702_14870 [Chloroflexota bacterium]